jgi:hypothetical protein
LSNVHHTPFSKFPLQPNSLFQCVLYYLLRFWFMAALCTTFPLITQVSVPRASNDLDWMMISQNITMHARVFFIIRIYASGGRGRKIFLGGEGGTDLIIATKWKTLHLNMKLETISLWSKHHVKKQNSKVV